MTVLQWLVGAQIGVDVGGKRVVNLAEEDKGFSDHKKWPKPTAGELIVEIDVETVLGKRIVMEKVTIKEGRF